MRLHVDFPGIELEAISGAIDYPRRRLVQILHRYNEEIENSDPLVEKNLERLAHPDQMCVVTGQQVGFMGGPAMTVIKALSCIAYAEAMDAVPIFWVASEDHDVGEVSRTFALSSSGDLRKYSVALPEGRFVEDLPLLPQHLREMERFCAELNLPWEPPRTNRYADTMIQTLLKAVSGRGLVFVEPYALRPLAVNLFAAELERAEELHSTLGKEGPLTFREGETQLFYKTDEGKRRRVLVGEELDMDPARLSSAAALRPLVQSACIPTAAYIAGPTELAYHRQLTGYFRAHGVPMPRIIQRPSVTFESDQVEDWLAAEELPGFARHYVANFLTPRGVPQERILNWWFLQSQTTENLSERLYQMISEATVS